MLQKKDIYYYRCLSYAHGGLGLGLLFFMFVAGVSAKYEISLVHMYMPYWLALPLLIQAAALYAASHYSSRKPLGFWLPFFFVALCGIGVYTIMLPAYKVAFYDRYPCLVQYNTENKDTRCVCSYSDSEYLSVSGADSSAPCFRALNILNVTTNINLLLTVLALVPEMLAFVLVCNDLCCISCRRSSQIPQMVIAGGNPNQPTLMPVQTEIVTYRTDEQPGGSAGQTAGGAGPLPQKPQNPDEVPHSF